MARINVLLIEDNPGDAELVKRSLAKARSKYAIHHVTRMSEGLEYLRQQPVDALLLDLSLPDSEQTITLSRIRDLVPGAPVVVLTSLASDQTAGDALGEGAEDYLLKDRINPELLERAIHYAIHRQQSRDANQRLLDELQKKQALLKKKNRKLERLHKMASRFVDNVSHEFRTPLTVITEYVSLIRDGLLGPVSQQQAHMLDTVSDRADDLNNMVDDMLDISKLEAGVLGSYRLNARLADVIQHVRPALERKATVRKVTLEFAIADELPEIYCDPEKVGRVLINLATNAIKFCGEPGKVSIWAKEAPSGDVICGVTDNGPGIDEDGIAVIFRRFKQLGGNLRGSTKGFGLGLNIAKELVDLNFGQMYVQSELGQGSTFSFSIPLADPHEILQRYLKRLAGRRNCATVLSLVSAHVDESTPANLTADTESYLNYLLRRNDLLFRIGPHRWMLALPATPEELASFLDRAANTWKETNRNRPHGLLPEVEFKTQGTWRAVPESVSILAAARELIEPGDAARRSALFLDKEVRRCPPRTPVALSAQILEA